jgi:hypothetical protein
MKTLIQYTYKCNETATVFGRQQGVMQCNLVIHDCINKFSALRQALNSARARCGDIIQIHYLGEFESKRLYHNFV